MVETWAEFSTLEVVASMPSAYYYSNVAWLGNGSINYSVLNEMKRYK